ncbi:MAG: hypothetical protein AABY22_16825 [Nanoarchaeota archaeon]
MAIEITNWLPIILGILGAIFGAMALGWVGEGNQFSKSKSTFKSGVTLVLIGLFVYGLISFGLQAGFNPLNIGDKGSAMFLAVAGTPAVAGVTDAGAVVKTETVTPTTSLGVALPVNTLTLINVAEKGSNKLAVTTGAFHFYKSGTDPKSATANAIDVISVASGSGSSTNKTLSTNTPYRVVFKGAGTYYDKDYGEYTIKNLNPNTGEAQFDAGEIATVGTISAFFTESRNASISGQTSFLLGTDEIGNTTSDILVYDESVGNEDYYLDVVLGFTGANTYVKKPVFCFENDLSNPPDSNDYTAITSSTRTGDRYKLDSDLISYWKDQKCYALPMNSGDYEGAGSSTTVRITFTPVEANLDANDDFFFLIDDLGSARGVDDSGSNRGATIVRQGIDHQA